MSGPVEKLILAVGLMFACGLGYTVYMVLA